MKRNLNKKNDQLPVFEKVFFRVAFIFFVVAGCLLCANMSAQDEHSLLLDSHYEKTLKNQPINDTITTKWKHELVTNNTFLVGIGGQDIYDTYLSPLRYHGFTINLISEKMRRTTWFDYRFYKQQIIRLELGRSLNPTGTAAEYNARFYYRLGGHYRMYQNNGFVFGLGGIWDITGGAIYNDRNGNNPVSARVYTNFNISAIASYKFKNFAFRWQLDTPLFGVMFSPQYGQSYYEIGQMGFGNLFCFTSLHNQRVLQNYFTVDIPISSFTIRVGYLGYHYQTKVNGRQTHNYINSFVIGMPIDGYKGLRKKAKNIYWDEQ